ncbi:unnamed protein product [Absidia cylindrospora]
MPKSAQPAPKTTAKAPNSVKSPGISAQKKSPTSKASSYKASLPKASSSKTSASKASASASASASAPKTVPKAISSQPPNNAAKSHSKPSTNPQKISTSTSQKASTNTPKATPKSAKDTTKTSVNTQKTTVKATTKTPKVVTKTSEKPSTYTPKTTEMAMPKASKVTPRTSVKSSTITPKTTVKTTTKTPKVATKTSAKSSTITPNNTVKTTTKTPKVATKTSAKSSTITPKTTVKITTKTPEVATKTSAKLSAYTSYTQRTFAQRTLKMIRTAQKSAKKGFGTPLRKPAFTQASATTRKPTTKEPSEFKSFIETLRTMKVPNKYEIVCTMSPTETNKILKAMTSEGTVFGLDMEWKPAFAKGSPENSTGLIQICGHSKILLIQASQMKRLPGELVNFLEDHNIHKTGVSVSGDAWKLHRDFGIKTNGLVEIAPLAKSAFEASPHIKDYGKYSLKAFAGTFLGSNMEKSKKVQLSNWNAKKLTKKQIDYASTDAYASYALYHSLMDISKLEKSNLTPYHLSLEKND